MCIPTTSSLGPAWTQLGEPSILPKGLSEQAKLMNQGGSGREPHRPSSSGSFILLSSRMARLVGLGQGWAWFSRYYLSLPSWAPLGPLSFTWLQLTPQPGKPFPP